MSVPDPRDGELAELPQKNLVSERKDKSKNLEAVGVRCVKKHGSILILLLKGVMRLLISK